MATYIGSNGWISFGGEVVVTRPGPHQPLVQIDGTAFKLFIASAKSALYGFARVSPDQERK